MQQYRITSGNPLIIERTPEAHEDTVAYARSAKRLIRRSHERNQRPDSISAKRRTGARDGQASYTSTAFAERRIGVALSFPWAT